MLGTGLPEIIIILVVAVLLFGPAALTFWLGYTMGSNRSPDAPPTPSAGTDDRPDTAPTAALNHDAPDTAPEESDDE